MTYYIAMGIGVAFHWPSSLSAPGGTLFET